MKIIDHGDYEFNMSREYKSKCRNSFCGAVFTYARCELQRPVGVGAFPAIYCPVCNAYNEAKPEDLLPEDQQPKG